MQEEDLHLRSIEECIHPALGASLKHQADKRALLALPTRDAMTKYLALLDKFHLRPVRYVNRNAAGNFCPWQMREWSASARTGCPGIAHQPSLEAFKAFSLFADQATRRLVLHRCGEHKYWCNSATPRLRALSFFSSERFQTP